MLKLFNQYNKELIDEMKSLIKYISLMRFIKRSRYKVDYWVVYK